MGPRPLGRGKLAARAKAVRIWRVDGAAASRPRKGASERPVANLRAPRRWGRGLSAAESERVGSLASQGYLRRWGRGLSAAESPRERRGRRAHNHASMGPRPLGRGKKYVATAFHALRPASMGPRPLGRGKWSAWPGLPCRRPRRWGRGLSAAESCSCGCCSHCPALRRWGRGLSAAESCLAHGGGMIRGPASMGPRPLGRGKRLQCGLQGGGQGASMGPRPLGRGKRRRGIAGHAQVPASMGPRPLGRGKPLRLNNPQPFFFASMGPRPLGRGKGQNERPFHARLSRRWGRGLSAAESGSFSGFGFLIACVDGAAASRPRKELARRQE